MSNRTTEEADVSESESRFSLPTFLNFSSPTRQLFEKAHEPFLTTVVGWFLLVVVVGLILSSFIALADRAPTIFSQRGAQGLVVAPRDGLFPLAGTLDTYLFTLVCPIVTVTTAAYFYKKFTYNLATGLFASVVYYVIFTVSVWRSFGVSVVGRPMFDVPAQLPTLGVILQFLLVGLTVVLFTQPLVPKWVVEKEREEVSLYIQNQWRFAQVTLSVALAGVFGASIPFAMYYSNIVNPFSLMFSVCLLGSPFLTVVLFYALRIHYIEKKFRDN